MASRAIRRFFIRRSARRSIRPLSRRPGAGARRPGRRNPPGRSKSRAHAALFIIMSILLMLTALIFTLMDRRLLPTVIRIEEYRIYTRINQAINDAVAALAQDWDLSAEDFYTVIRADDGRVVSLSANTVLINEITAHLSQTLLSILSRPVLEYVRVPLGALLGVEWLANVGPTYRIRVMPIGMANVDHYTSFSAAGINQINFQVWLTVSAKMQVINPLQARELDVSRSLPLVNAVFTGEIPGIYMGPSGATIR